MRRSRFRERVLAAVRGALLDWRAGIAMTAAGGGFCGLLIGAGLGVFCALSQSSTVLGRILMGLFDALVGGVAGCVFGSVVGGLMGFIAGLLSSPIMLGLAMMTESNPIARNASELHGPRELTPADTPGGRGDETTPAG
jgi:hypothetical protein